MTLRRTVATTRRVLRQLRHDLRTVALILAVPAVLMGLLAWILHGRAGDFNQFGPPLLGIFPLIVMFLVTSVATLRERTSGTLERLLTTPLAKADFVMGYALAFGLSAVVQALVVSGLSFSLYGLHVSGSAWLVVVVAVMDALLGTALGLSLSALASTEFQAVQFMPAFILPQLLRRVHRGDLRVPARHRCGGNVCGGRPTDRRCDPPPPDPLGHSGCPRTEGDPFGVGEELHERCATSQWKSAAVARRDTDKSPEDRGSVWSRQPSASIHETVGPHSPIEHFPAPTDDQMPEVALERKWSPWTFGASRVVR